MKYKSIGLPYKDPERQKEYNRKYYINNKEDIKTYNKKHKKERKINSKKWYKNHKEEKKIYDKEYNRTCPHQTEEFKYLKV